LAEAHASMLDRNLAGLGVRALA